MAELSPLDRAAEHPRPQLTRAAWTDLCGQWGFAYDDADQGCAAGWPTQATPFTRTITVPFPPEAPASGIGDASFHPIVWYRRTFHDPRRNQQGNRQRRRLRNHRVLLHCGAIDYAAQVWVNGQLVATHEGGQTPFSADITAALRPRQAEQVLVIRAADDPFDLAQPRGKQYWEAQSRGIWHSRTTGIWQPVWLEVVHHDHIASVRWTPDASAGTLTLGVRLSRAPQQRLHLRVVLHLGDRLLADDTYLLTGQETSRTLELLSGSYTTTAHRQQLLWAPEHPNLITAELTLTAAGQTVDTVESYAGLRSVAVIAGRFCLNGRPYYQRLVLEQGYWPTSHLAAPTAAALQQEVALVKELGFNGVRIHQKVEDPRFLYWCDRLGLLVWGEMANAFAFTPAAVQRLTQEWQAVIERDYSHPSIVAWMPINESWGVPNLPTSTAEQHFVQAIYHLTHALDGTRPVLGNDGWELLASDLWGIHDYSPQGDRLRERYGTPEALARRLAGVDPAPQSHPLAIANVTHQGQPVLLTEFGGIAYAPASGERWYGYDTVADADQFLARYAEYLAAVLACAPLQGFCYTQLTDTAQETNGLLTADRQHKLDPATVRVITAAPSRNLPAEVIHTIQRRVQEATGKQVIG